LDNLHNSIGPVVVGYGQFLHNGWFYSHPVVGSSGGSIDSSNHRSTRSFITTPDSKFDLRI
jgi:hypothetical protein